MNAELGEKQGGKCCFFCCDMRRAVIILGIVAGIENLFFAFVALTTPMIDDADTLPDNASLYSIGFFTLCFFYIFQIVAAVKYNVCMLVTIAFVDVFASIYSVFAAWSAGLDDDLGAGIIWLEVIGIVISYLIFLLPVVLLIREIDTGIMSEATYPREAFSLCCDPKV